MATNITQTTTDSDSVTLKKDAKGNYAWEIKVYGSKHDTVLKQVQDIDNQLAGKYPAKKEV